MNKLPCHCGGIEAEVNVPENGFEKVMRCNCSICKRKGYIIGVVQPDDFKLTKGCLLYTSPSPRDRTRSRMPSSA